MSWNFSYFDFEFQIGASIKSNMCNCQPYFPLKRYGPGECEFKIEMKLGGKLHIRVVPDSSSWLSFVWMIWFFHQNFVLIFHKIIRSGLMATPFRIIDLLVMNVVENMNDSSWKPMDDVLISNSNRYVLINILLRNRIWKM